MQPPIVSLERSRAPPRNRRGSGVDLDPSAVVTVDVVDDAEMLDPSPTCR